MQVVGIRTYQAQYAGAVRFLCCKAGLTMGEETGCELETKGWGGLGLVIILTTLPTYKFQLLLPFLHKTPSWLPRLSLGIP